MVSRGPGQLAHSLACRLSIALLVTLGMPSTGSAQLGGLIRRATGVGDMLEMKSAYDERKKASRVGGTWEIEYVFNGVDTARVVARTFANPDIGLFQERAYGRARGERGHMLTSVAAPTLAQLPADWRTAGGRKGEYGGGPVIIYPMTTDSLATERSYMIAMSVWMPASCFNGDEDRQKMWNKRLDRLFGGHMIGPSGAIIRDGYDTRNLAEANTIIRADSSGLLRATYVKKSDTLTVSARRISRETYSNDAKPGLLPTP